MEYIIAFIILGGLSVIAFFYFFSMISYTVNGIPQVSSFESDLRVMRKELKKYNLKGKKIIDLGSGIGKITRFFEKEFSAITYGCEIDYSNYFLSKIFNKIYGCNTNFTRGSYLEIILKDYDYIYIYLYPKIIDKAEIEIWKKAKPGTIIFSNAFQFKNHKPIEILTDEKGKEEIYVYEVERI